MNWFRAFSACVLLAALAAAQPPVLRKGVSVQMAVTTNAVAMPDADRADSLVVAVTHNGTVYLEVTALTPAQLSEKLRAEAPGNTGRKVYLKSDARTPFRALSKVLDALRTAGIAAPVLLTNQRPAGNASYVPPTGLDVLLTAPTEVSLSRLRVGKGQPSSAELKQQAQRGRPVALQIEAETPFGDIAAVVDACRAAGATVFLLTVEP